MSQSLKEAADMFQAGRLDDAAKEAQLSLIAEHSLFLPRYVMAHVYERRGDREKFEQWLHKTLEFKEDHGPTLDNLCVVAGYIRQRA